MWRVGAACGVVSAFLLYQALREQEDDSPKKRRRSLADILQGTEQKGTD